MEKHPPSVRRCPVASTFLFIGLLFLAALSGCGGAAGTAVDQAVLSELLPHLMKPVPETVLLACNTPDVLVAAGIGPPGGLAAAGAIRIGEVKDVRPERGFVGNRFDQYHREGIPLALPQGTAVEKVLAEDIAEILGAGGLAADGSPSVRLDLEVAEAWVNAVPPRWYQFRGTIRGTFAFRAVFTEEGSASTHQETFSGVGESREAFLSRKDYEKALSKAYCSALSSFAGFVSSRFMPQAAGHRG